MKTLFITTGTSGDVLPFIELARKRSNSVVIANENFRMIAEAAGATFTAHSTAKDYADALRNPWLWDRDIGTAAKAAVKLFAEPVSDSVHNILRSIPEGQCQIVAHPLCLAAFESPHPTTTAMVSPAMLETPFVYDIPPGVGLWPEWYSPGTPQIVPTDFRILIEDVTEISPKLMRLLNRHPVLITFGSAACLDRGIEAYKAAVSACRKLKLPMIVLGGPRWADAPDLYQTEYLPLWYPLKFCSAMIHHGGIGTCAIGFRTGVKQVIHPFGLDQFDNAGRCQTLGHFVALDPKEIAGKLEQAVSHP